ncbi:MAG TPA: hypothetical protein VGY55_05645 [Pirellulales bacterium]|nr:hypothetical protein [Pirellulales bacterium]
MKRLLAPMIVLAIVATATAVRAADDPTGTWKFSMKAGNNQTRDVTIKLKLDGDKLTGSIAGRTNDTPITDGQYKDGDISFSVVRERNGNKFTTKYSGKLSGDGIKGKIESERNGQTNTQDWDAKREKA